MTKFGIIVLLFGCAVTGFAEEKSIRDKVVEAGQKTGAGLGKGVQKVRGLICGDGKKHCGNPAPEETPPKSGPVESKPSDE